MKKLINKIKTEASITEQDAWWLLEAVTKKSKATLIFSDERLLPNTKTNKIKEWINKIKNEKIPLSYLIGEVPFLNLKIKVESPILIPRPETEEWIAKLIGELQPSEKLIKNILEIGTGSGCIAIAVAKAFPGASITATDINQKALDLAAENAILNGAKNISFIKSDLFSNIDKNKKFDLIISNPPYINPEAEKNITPEVLNWEDKKALFSEDKGLKIIKSIIKESQIYIKKNSSFKNQLIFEHDEEQAKDIQIFAKDHDWSCKTKKDLFGKDRTTWCKIIDSRDR